MNASGNTISFAPVLAASAIRRTALSMHAAVSKGTLPACTTATCTVCCAVFAVMTAPGARSCKDLDRVVGEGLHQARDVIVPRRLDGADHAHGRQVGPGERAIVHDLLHACAGRGDHVRETREPSRTIADRHREARETSIRDQTR